MAETLTDIIGNQRILFITNETYPSMAGGGRNAFYFANYLAQSARAVSMYVLNLNNELKELEKLGDVTVTRVPYKKKNIFTRVISLLKLIPACKEAIARHDIIMFYGGFFPGYEHLIHLAHKAEKKTLLRSSFLGGDDLETIKRRNPLLWPVRKRIFKNLSVYFAINSKFAERWENTMGSTTQMFSSFQGVNTNVFQKPQPDDDINILKTIYEIPSGVPIILSCGLLIERKGYRFIFDELAKVDKPFLYVIAGAYEPDKRVRIGSRERHEMKRLYKYGRFKLGGKVRFLGMIEKMEKLYPIADVFLHGAKEEGTSNVLLEAMAMGRTPLVPRLTGLTKDLLQENENALIYDSYGQIPGKINELLEDKVRTAKIGYNASYTISQNYTFEKVGIALFKRIM